MNEINSLKKKIKYRSEYRGIKEMDLLLGKFVNKYINKLKYDELLQLYEVLEFDDDTIFKWYSNSNNNNLIPKNKITKMLKEFKPSDMAERGFDTEGNPLLVFKTSASTAQPPLQSFNHGYSIHE